MISLEFHEPRLPSGLICHQSIQFLSFDSDHICCQGCFYHVFTIGFRNAGQDPPNFHGFKGIKDVTRTPEDARDIELRQGLLHKASLSVCPHQDSYVFFLERSFSQEYLVVSAETQKS